MKRLIIVPQFPTPLRYQEWWWKELPIQMAQYFEEIVILGYQIGMDMVTKIDSSSKSFAPIQSSIDLELAQIREYMQLELWEGDVLLLNDCSFPGIFANVLFHKKPKKCFAICHATSKNELDYFQPIREIKYPVEKEMAQLFDKIIVGSRYHKEKLGWSDISVLPLPNMPVEPQQTLSRSNFLVSVGRKVPQKRDWHFERTIEEIYRTTIESPAASSWEEYYEFLSRSMVMLITSKEETFGYQVLDAINNGCIPLAPNRCSYPELLPEEYLYERDTDLVGLIQDVIDGKLKPLQKVLTHQRSEDFYRNLAQLMR